MNYCCCRRLHYNESEVFSQTNPWSSIEGKEFAWQLTGLIFPSSVIHLSGLNSFQSFPHTHVILPIACMAIATLVFFSMQWPLGRMFLAVLNSKGRGGHNLSVSHKAAWRYVSFSTRSGMMAVKSNFLRNYPCD